MPWASVRGRVIAGFGLLVLVLGCVTVGASWQVRRHQTDLAELEYHSTRASLIQNVETQASIAGLLLQRYVDAGGDNYAKEIDDHAIAAQLSLQQVLEMGGPPGFDAVTSTGLRLMQDASRAAELRRIGQVEQARQVLEDIVPTFRTYRLSLEAMTADELARVTELRATADEAGQLAFWLLVSSGGIGVLLGLITSVAIARSILRPLGSLEETALRASEGDLAARAPARGPREFAHLGSVMNEMMAAVEARAAELKKANEKLTITNRELTDARSEAATDPLTGLGNHRSFHKRLRDDIASASDQGGKLGLIIIDLDGFKTINDSLGHPAGDELLREVARILTDGAHSKDTYRYGGDELAVIVPGGNHPTTMEVADALRARISGLTSQGGPAITASFGVGSYPETATKAEELVYRADMAMYWAKSLGKNRVCSWRDLSEVGGAGSARAYSGNRQGHADLVTSLCDAIEAKDHPTREHGERCAVLSSSLAEELGLSDREVADVKLASLLHDIGKLLVPNAILHKPGPLTSEETQVMLRHSTDGASMLSHSPPLSSVLLAVRHHHERFDGDGYPDGLSGERIPLSARILFVADAYDAMTSDRPYRKAVSEDEAIAELQRCAGTQFDPRVVDAFLRVLSRRGDSAKAPGVPGALTAVKR